MDKGFIEAVRLRVGWNRVFNARSRSILMPRPPMLRADSGGFADSARYGMRQVASFGTSDNGPLSRRGFLS